MHPLLSSQFPYLLLGSLSGKKFRIIAEQLYSILVRKTRKSTLWIELTIRSANWLGGKKFLVLKRANRGFVPPLSNGILK